MIALDQKYKPRRVEEFVGIEGPRAILRKLVESPFSSNWLLIGDAGTGKTSMAFAVADQIGGQVYHIPSRSCDLETVAKICDQCHYMPMFGGSWNFVIVDEADQMTGPAQLAFLSKLDGSDPLPNTIFFFTCNETKKLEKRFKSRTHRLYFEVAPDSPSAIAHLATIWRAEAGNTNPPDLAAMLRDSGGNLRDCLMQMETEIMLLRQNTPPAPATPAEGIGTTQVQSLYDKTLALVQALLAQPNAEDLMLAVGDQTSALLTACGELLPAKVPTESPTVGPEIETEVKEEAVNA